MNLQPEGFSIAPTDLRHTTLLGFMTPEFKDTIVTHVLDRRSLLPSDVRRKLESAINSSVRIPQFPKQPARAPLPFLKQPIISLLSSSESLTNAVLQGWFVSQETLYAIVKAHLHIRNVDVDYPNFVAHRLRGSWPHGDWVSQRNSILAANGDLNQNDVALMLCFATDKMPTGAGDVAEEEPSLMDRDILGQVLGYLEQLPSDAAEWESDVPGFLLSVEELIGAKKVERESAARIEELHLRISELGQKHLDLLDYLELEVSAWRAATTGLTSAKAAEAMDLLTELSASLEQFDRDPKGASVSETQRLREEHDKAVQRIQHLKEGLDNLLTPCNVPDGGPSELAPSSTLPTEERDASRESGTWDINAPDVVSDYDPLTENYTIEPDKPADQLDIPPAVADNNGKNEVPVQAPDDDGIQDLQSDNGNSASNLSAYLWSLVADDDLAGAYWVARSIAAQGFTPPVPPALLKAVQGARWLSPDSDDYVQDLFVIERELGVLEDADVHVLLRLAASLPSAVAAPETNLLAWLSAPHGLPEIERVVSSIRNFANWGYRLLPEHVNGNEGNQHVQSLITGASEDAGAWLEEYRQHHHKFARADNVWQYLSKDGRVDQMLAPVSKDKRSEIGTVQSHVDYLSQDENIADTINQIDRDLLFPSLSKEPIVGSARDWLVRRIRQAVSRAARWCELVSREATSGQQDSWLVEQATGLRKQLDMEGSDCMEALLQLASRSTQPDIAASARCAAYSLQQLMNYLNLKIQTEPLEQPAIVYDLKMVKKHMGEELVQDDAGLQLELAVSKRLLWVSPAPLNDSGLLLSENSLASIDWPSSDTSLEGAIQHRIECRDFRFFDLLAMGLSQDRLVTLKSRFAAALVDGRKTLHEAMKSTREEIDQAAKDGVIEFDGSRWHEHSQKLDDVNIEEELNFEPIHDVLDDIKNSLRADGLLRRQELLDEWQTLSSESPRDADLYPEPLDALITTFEMASSPDALDIRVMEECVSRLRDTRSREEGLVGPAPQEEGQPHALEEFLAFFKEIRDPKSHVQNNNGLRSLVRDS